jgi:hypothetical protein
MIPEERIKKQYICTNCHLWAGNFDKTDRCPKCGEKTSSVIGLSTGCSFFYKHHSDLHIRNTGVSSAAGQEAHIEEADIEDLLFFISKAFPEKNNLLSRFSTNQ